VNKSYFKNGLEANLKIYFEFYAKWETGFRSLNYFAGMSIKLFQRTVQVNNDKSCR